MEHNTTKTIIITGPTGVGKTELSLQLAASLNGEIINGDMGQFYTPLSIGTAKPDWRAEAIPHHLFDIIDEPVNFSVAAYRDRIAATIKELRSRGKTPIIVGGSLFYIKSLFFPPLLRDGVASPLLRQGSQPSFLPRSITLPAFTYSTKTISRSGKLRRAGEVINSGGAGASSLHSQESQCPLGDVTAGDALSVSWDELNQLDPQRAQEIDPHDTYRISRAVALARQGHVPSELKPMYAPLEEDMILIHLVRERAELYQRINDRTTTMLTEGWLDEVKNLSESWRTWLRTKKMIGYDTIIDYQSGRIDFATCRATIQQRTRNYAKRQITFWRSFREQLEAVAPGTTHEINLTLSPVALYLERLLKSVIKPH